MKKKWLKSIYLKTLGAFLVLVVLMAIGLGLTLNQLKRLRNETRTVERAWQLYDTTSDIRFSLDASLRSLINALASGNREEGKKILQHMSDLRLNVQHLEALQSATQTTTLESTTRQTRLDEITHIVDQIDALFYETLRLVVFAEHIKESGISKQLEQASDAWRAPTNTENPEPTSILTDSLQAFSQGDLKHLKEELEKYFPNFQKFSNDLLTLEANLKDEKPKELIQKLAQLTSQLGIELQEFSRLVREDLIAAMKRVEEAHRAAVIRLWILGIVSVAVAIVVSILFAHHLTRPIEQLRFSVEHLSRGEFDTTHPITTQDEIGELAKAFNEMSARLKHFYAELDKKVKERTKDLEKANKDLKQSQQQLIQAAKMTSIGILAAGMAHEIRNPLGVIKSSTGMLRKGTMSEAEQKELLEMMAQETDRLNSLITSLLDFAKPKPLHVTDVLLSEVIEKALKWTQKELESRRIQVRKQLDPQAGHVKIDADQFHQVFLNLILNAEDAMPNGGELVIETQKQDHTIKIRVKDTGCGIPKELQEHIFEPFYTNKERGVGLGLSIVYRILEAHGGQIAVESRLNEGSCFILTLPTVV